MGCLPPSCGMRIAIERREIRIALWTVLELLAEENEIQTKAVKMRERTSFHGSNKAMNSINDMLCIYIYNDIIYIMILLTHIFIY